MFIYPESCIKYNISMDRNNNLNVNVTLANTNWSGKYQIRAYKKTAATFNSTQNAGILKKDYDNTTMSWSDVANMYLQNDGTHTMKKVLP